ncbi:hypothetical protein SF06_04230 [Pseudomonas flexibilis]|nr:hypothetical protein SF06_04230 [Pseudomonas flexibilis]
MNSPPPDIGWTTLSLSAVASARRASPAAPRRPRLAGRA